MPVTWITQGLALASLLMLAAPSHARPDAPNVIPLPALPGRLQTRLDGLAATWAKDRKRAERDAAAIVADAEAVLGPTDPALARALVTLGAIQTAVDHPATGLASTERARGLIVAALGPRHPALRVVAHNALLARELVAFAANEYPSGRFDERPDPMADIPWDYAGMTAVLYAEPRPEARPLEVGSTKVDRDFNAVLYMGPDAGLRFWLTTGSHDRARRDPLVLARQRLTTRDPLWGEIVLETYGAAGCEDAAALEPLTTALRAIDPGRWPGRNEALFNVDFDKALCLAAAGRFVDATILVDPWESNANLSPNLREMLRTYHANWLIAADDEPGARSALERLGRDAEPWRMTRGDVAARKAWFDSFRDAAGALRKLLALADAPLGEHERARYGEEISEVALVVGDVATARARLAEPGSYVWGQFITGSERAVDLSIAVGQRDPGALALGYDTMVARKARELERMVRLHERIRTVADPEPRAALAALDALYARLGRAVADDSVSHAEILALSAAIEQQEHWVRNLGLVYVADAVAPDGAAIRAALPAGTALVEYCRFHPFVAASTHLAGRFAPWHYGAFVMREGTTRFFDLGAVAAIDLDVARLRSGLIAGDDVSEPANALGASVWAPLQEAIGPAPHVFVAPIGALSLVPFDVVREGGAPLSYLTTGRDLARTASPASKSPPVVLADPSAPSPSWPALPGARAEALAVAKVLPGALTLVGSDATKPALKSIQHPRVLHVASHGYYVGGRAAAFTGSRGMWQGDHPVVTAGEPAPTGVSPLLLSGLVLAAPRDRADDFYFSALEASALDLVGTQLVVLSGCETGLGAVDADEGVQGLRYALMMAGAESAVVSLWKVDDAATRELMVAFYRGLAAGKGRAVALREAQMSQRKAGRPARDWAAFVLAGAVGPISNETAPEAPGPAPLVAPREVGSISLPSAKCSYIAAAGPDRVQVNCVETRRFALVDLAQRKVVRQIATDNRVTFTGAIALIETRDGLRASDDADLVVWSNAAPAVWSADNEDLVAARRDLVVTSRWKDVLIGRDRDSGAVRWQRTLEGAYASLRWANDDARLFAVRPHDSSTHGPDHLSVLDLASGNTLWSVMTAGTSMAVGPNVVVTYDHLFNAPVNAYRAHDGAAFFSVTGGEGAALVGTTLVARPERHFGIDWDVGVLLRDLATGVPRWDIHVALGESRAYVFGDGDRFYLIDKGGALHVYDAANRREAVTAKAYSDVTDLIWNGRLVGLAPTRLILFE